MAPLGGWPHGLAFDRFYRIQNFPRPSRKLKLSDKFS